MTLTYSSYLVHSPLQVGMLMVMDLYAVDRGVVFTKPFFALYLGSLLLLSLLAYKLVEVPARRWLRRYANPNEAIADITHYIVGFYNTHRLHSTLGYRSPADYAKATA